MENPKHLGGTCKRNVNRSHKANQCDVCNYWNHIKCDKLDNKLYETLITSEEPHICNQCKDEEIPFQKLSNEQLFTSIVKGINKEFDAHSNPNDINRCSEQDETSAINCQYYDADSMLSKLEKNKNFSFLHMNI